MRLKNAQQLGEFATMLSISTAFQDGLRLELHALSATKSGSSTDTVNEANSQSEIIRTSINQENSKDGLKFRHFQSLFFTFSNLWGFGVLGFWVFGF